ncbi:MAG: FAD-dependent monooxygenase [Marivivens sp.]|nr:FAD-dependent monooxygenase [Marivivens sp.]
MSEELKGRSVAVIGGGLGGLSASLCLRSFGADVTVYEQAAVLREVGAGIQLTPNAVRALNALGLAEGLDTVSVRSRALVPVDARSGQALARFRLDLVSEDAPYRFVHRGAFLALLADAARTRGVEIRTGEAMRADDPALAQYDLVVGAEGLHSISRGLLNGADRPFFTGQVAWRAVIPAAAAPEARVWMAPGKHVVSYPLSSDTLNIVAIQERDEWAAEGWHHADHPAHLRAAFADCGAELHGLLAQVEEVALWGLFRHPVAARWQDGARLALIGDAAHPTLPFLAQGANLAIEDGYVLARCLAGAETQDKALASYEAQRKPRVSRAIAEANANAKRYHMGPVMGLGRAVALGLIGKLAPERFLRRYDWLYGFDPTA